MKASPESIPIPVVASQCPIPADALNGIFVQKAFSVHKTTPSPGAHGHSTGMLIQK
jgi:hypothetical protein